ncbi:MAG: glucosidase [Planctomycetes bacterium]|nr:glucosidase [Planctomycetota bacterium]
MPAPCPETQRLEEDARRVKNWKRWGPYLAERQWATVREDYSEWGNCWDYFPHDHARSRAYRWGEDGLLGFTDRQGRVCFALALWNERDPILKERLFGLTGPEGNHGEDVKEEYYYVDSTPTHSYCRALYKYPQTEFPYGALVEGNRHRSKHAPELELADTGVFAGNRYFDVGIEYAKASPDDMLIRVTVVNRGPNAARLHVLPTVWCRNTWSWGCTHEGCEVKPRIVRRGEGLEIQQSSLGKYHFDAEGLGGAPIRWMFTENETNTERLYGVPNSSRFVKDAFHRAVVEGKADAVNPSGLGTKAAAHHVLNLAPGERVVLRMRFRDAGEATSAPFGPEFDRTFDARLRECEQFYAARIPAGASDEERAVARQAYAGLLWSKQFFHYSVRDWLRGDPEQPPPPGQRAQGRNSEWQHFFARDVISMPDKWEYPWFAAWDLAFHMVPFARIDPHFSKEQLILLLREWYMHPNGQIPAYEFAFGDVNPPVHAWAAWRVYKMSGNKGSRDRVFLARVFQKLLLNFTWWVNRKDAEGRNLFSGGFLGLDNIGVFDRSKPLPTGGHLEQADGTAWMAFYCATMLSMALELAAEDPAYEDVASKFFEHFVAITDAMNTLGGTGLWDPEDGFYYDQLHVDGRTVPMRVRSMVGIIPLFACEILEQRVLDRLPGFTRRMNWFLRYRDDLARHISYMNEEGCAVEGRRLLAIPSRDRLERVLRYVLDENEFLSPHGVRSVSRVHREKPYTFWVNGMEHRLEYEPGESASGLFGGNSNWRGPIWFPVNYLLVEALERYHHFYGDSFKVECPTGSGRWMNLGEVAVELDRRLTSIFLPNGDGKRPFAGDDPRYATDPHWRRLVLFHEYFHGETGRGLGASHQTGWTALVARCIEKQAKQRKPR